MTENEFDEALETLLELPAGDERNGLLANLSEDQRVVVARMLEVDDQVWESTHGAPPLHSDPVAAMLGLVPDASFRLDSKTLTENCSRSHVPPSKLAERLQARGWKVDAADVFRWQNSVASDVSPALIRAIAEELRVDPDKLVSPLAAKQAVLDTVVELVTATKRFGELVERFATAQRVSPGMAQTMLRTRMLATVHRGKEPGVDQMLESLEALVSALEAS